MPKKAARTKKKRQRAKKKQHQRRTNSEATTSKEQHPERKSGQGKEIQENAHKHHRVEGNFVAECSPGCHIAHYDAPWIVGTEPFDPEAFGLDPGVLLGEQKEREKERAEGTESSKSAAAGEEGKPSGSKSEKEQSLLPLQVSTGLVSASVPDLSIDPEEGLFSAINSSNEERCYYVTISGIEAAVARAPPKVSSSCSPVPKNHHSKRQWQRLQMGTTVTENSEKQQCITFVLRLKPKQVMDVCYLKLKEGGFAALDMFSDVNVVKEHPSPSLFDEVHVFPFPLGAKEKDRPQAFLCSQGMGGCFTHFYAGTMHAVDFACPVGTPVLAVSDGVIVEVKQENKASGIHAKNLFKWNSIMLELETGVVVEYVHIEFGSARVKEGDKVVKGQVVCDSGTVGFCPQPHLHIQVHASKDPEAPTIQFALEGKAPEFAGGVAGKDYYFPIAGMKYNAEGFKGAVS